MPEPERGSMQPVQSQHAEAQPQPTEGWLDPREIVKEVVIVGVLGAAVGAIVAHLVETYVLALHPVSLVLLVLCIVALAFASWMTIRYRRLPEGSRQPAMRIVAVSLFIVGPVLGILAYVMHIVLSEPEVIRFDIDWPRHLSVQEDRASVCGHLEYSGNLCLSEMQIVIYITGVKPKQGGRWRRSNLPCLVQVKRRWTVSSDCIAFPIEYSHFCLVAILVKEEQAEHLPLEIAAEDGDELRSKLCGYVYPVCGDANSCNSISPMYEVVRAQLAPVEPAETPIQIRPEPTPTLAAMLTPAPTGSPTPTRVPTATPTEEAPLPGPTEPPSPTPTPTATPTPTPSVTHTPRPPAYPPPVLGNVDIFGCSLTFYWEGQLPEDGYFALRVGIGAPGESRTWTKGTQYGLILTEPGEYVWEVAICQGDPEKRVCNHPVVSERASFSFMGCGKDRP